jgi:hypothetical protein
MSGLSHIDIDFNSIRANQTGWWMNHDVVTNRGTLWVETLKDAQRALVNVMKGRLIPSNDIIQVESPKPTIGLGNEWSANRSEHVLKRSHSMQMHNRIPA